MLKHAWAQGVPMAWVAGDEVYGDAPYLRDGIAGAGKRYVLAVSSTTPVWKERPPVVEPFKGRLGRPREKPRLAEGAPLSETVAAVIAALPGDAWKRLTVSEGEKGPRTYDWTAIPIVESRNGLPGPDGCLLARRSIPDPSDLAYYLSNAPPRRRRWRLWPRSRRPVGASRPPLKKGRERQGSTSTKSVTGIAGIVTSPSP